jgi:hypothetical protein
MKLGTGARSFRSEYGAFERCPAREAKTDGKKASPLAVWEAATPCR